MTNKTRKLGQEEIEYLHSLDGHYTSDTAASMLFDKFGVEVTGSAVRYQWKLLREFGLTRLVDEDELMDSPSKHQMEESGDKIVITSIIEDKIKTVDQLLDYMEIDREQWELDKSVIAKADKPVREGEGYRIEQLVQVKAYLKKRPPVIDYKAIGEEIKQEILTMKKPNVGKQTYVGGNNMLLLNIFDAHIGKLAIAEEVGEPYDINKASALFIVAASSIISKAKRDGLSKIVIPIGNDLFNADNALGTTTSGTPQDNASLYRETFRKVRRVVNDVIQHAKTFAPVEVITIPGNHDYYSVLALGDVLEATYENDPDVTIINNDSPRKYVAYGNSLIGFTHGSEEKIDNLPMIMLRECAGMLEDKEYFDWYLGHIHTSKHGYNKISDELGGVQIHFEPSISGTDSRHHKKGYIGNRKGARGIVYSKTEGPISIYPFNV